MVKNQSIADNEFNIISHINQNVMNKIKLAFAAIAFITASGAAFATNNVKTDTPDCSEVAGCQADDQQVCCFDQATQQDRLGQRIGG
jgi:hypothetical protein